MITSTNWADILDPIVRHWFQQGFQRRTALLPRLFNVQSSERSYEQASSAGAVGLEGWDQWEISGKIGKADFDQGYKKTYTHKEYPMEMEVQRKFLDDNMFKQVTDPAIKLGDSAALKREVDAASVFNNAFSASFTGADAVALCSASHPLSPQKTGATQSNTGTLALTKDNVKTTREAMMAFTDDNTNKVAITPDLLLVPPGLEDEGMGITQSLLDPDSANNKINAQHGRFQVLPWHYLTDSNNWFMIDSTYMKMVLEWFDRVPLSITPKEGDKTLVATWIAYQRYSFGWSDWRFVYGHNVA